MTTHFSDPLAELADARAATERQGPLYRPSAFWHDASCTIVDELRRHGFDGFRGLPTPLSFFVPTYGTPGNGFSAGQRDELLEGFAARHPQAAKPQLALQQFLGGEAAALADYRVLLAADEAQALPHLHTFSESTAGRPVEQMVFDGRRFSRSSLNYLLGLALLKKHLRGDVPRTVLEIGGGFGTLGEVMAAAGIDGWRYIDVDIPPTSSVAAHYLRSVLGRDRVAGWAEVREREVIPIQTLPSASVLCAWQIERLQGEVDLFVNFISFQEMEPAIVRNYLGHVQRLNARWVLLRNLREGKQKRAGHAVGVEEPILGDDYLKMLPGHELVARSTLPFGHRTVDGFHSELLLLKRRA
jgi:putative sugar O-methyltransferase